MTRRQFKAWKAWLDKQWNEPSRADYYAMQAALEARESQQRRKSGNVSSMRIRFKEAKLLPKADPMAAVEASKKRMIAAFGGLDRIKVTYVEKPDGSRRGGA